MLKGKRMKHISTLVILILLFIISPVWAGDINVDLIDVVEKGDIVILKALLKKGANVNARTESGSTALIQAAQYYGYKKIVKILLDNGADVNAKTNNEGFFGGYTALMKAVESDRTEIAKLLLDRGADVNAKDSRFGNSVLMIAIYNKCLIPTIKILLDHGADVNAKANNGKTVLKWAKERGNQKIITMLKEAGAKK